MNNSLEGTNENNAQRKQQRELDNATEETPLVVLRLDRKWNTMGDFMVILCTLFLTFGVLFPVITTGDYAEVWLGEHIVTKVALFYLSLIAIPACIFYILLLPSKGGTYLFYNNRLEVYTLWFSRKIIMRYERMHVIRTSSAIIITPRKIPDWSKPLQHLKMRWWEAKGFGTNFVDLKIAGMKAGLDRTWEKPNSGPKALQILKEKAFSFIEK